MQPQSLPPSTSPLDQLADIHLPDTINWWPLAPGWWILFGLIILAALGFYCWRKHKIRNAYRLVAQRELNSIYTHYEQTRDTAAYLHAISILLRRTALTAYPQQFNASIKGEAWLQWLDSVCPAHAEHFCSASGQSLLIGAYQKNPTVDALALHRLCDNWIKYHANQHQLMRSISKKNSANKNQSGAAHV
jgi:hypothetical protein